MAMTFEEANKRFYAQQKAANEAALVDKIRNTADPLGPDSSIEEDRKAPPERYLKKVIRKLRWKRKEYLVEKCIPCGKVRPLILYSTTELPRCYKCLYRRISELDKIAADLQSATLGGEYLPEELEREVELVDIDKKAFARLTRDMMLYSMNGATTIKWSKPNDSESFPEGFSLLSDEGVKMAKDSNFSPTPITSTMLSKWNTTFGATDDRTDPGDSIDTVYDQTRDKQMENRPSSKLEKGS